MLHGLWDLGAYGFIVVCYVALILGIARFAALATPREPRPASVYAARGATRRRAAGFLRAEARFHREMGDAQLAAELDRLACRHYAPECRRFARHAKAAPF